MSPAHFKSLDGSNFFDPKHEIRIELTHSSILYGSKPVNRLPLDFLIAHEIAHIYTGYVDGKVAGFSRETLNDIKSSVKACLYGDEDKRWKIGEDLADHLGAIMLNELRPNVTREEAEAGIRFFCHLSGNRKTVGTEGHSLGKERAQMFVRSNKSAQKALGCKVDENFCSIKIK